MCAGYVALAMAGLTMPLMAQDPPSATPASQSPDLQVAPSEELIADPIFTEEQFRDSLARYFAQSARQYLQRPQVFIGSLDAARELVQQAVILAPNNQDIWRTALDLGSVLEEGDPLGKKLGKDALQALSRLDPSDEGVRLRRLVDVIAESQTAEGRIATMLQLLTPEAIAQIGPRVASRLVFELATLTKRTGDLDGYEKWLLESTRLDPWFPDAANEAAGYFRLRVSPIEEAGLLRAAALANPSDAIAMLALAQLCLDNGAYQGAVNVLEVECAVLHTARPNIEYDTLLADLVLAFWGTEQTTAASAVFVRRQQELDIALRSEVIKKGALISAERRRALQLPPAPALITNVAAMLVSRRLPGADVVVQNADLAFKIGADAAAEVKLSPQSIAAVSVERAFVALWLGGKVETASAALIVAKQLSPLSADAQARFDGWFAFRAGDLAKAEGLFAPLVSNDVASKLGLAMVLEAQGRVRDAAPMYLAIAQSQPASAVGLYARESLWRLLGSKPQLFPLAPQLDAQAVIPESFRSLIENPAEALLLTVQPRVSKLNMFEPVKFDFVITNRGEWPITITPNGPLRDTATAACTVSMAGQQSVRIPPYEAVALTSRLALASGEAMTVTYDASIGDGTRQFKLDPTVGGFANVHGILNWRTTQQGMEPGPLGIEVESDTVRIEGMRLSSAWVTRAIKEISDPSKSPSPVTIAYLACALARLEARKDSLSVEMQSALEPVALALTTAVARLTPLEAAWVASCVPAKRENLAAFYAVLDANPDPLVRIARLAVQPETPDVGLIEVTLRDGPLQAQAFARAAQAHGQSVVEERRDELNISK